MAKRRHPRAYPPAALEFMAFVYRDIGDKEIVDYLNVFYPRHIPWTKGMVSSAIYRMGLFRTAVELMQIRRRNKRFGSYAQIGKKMWDTRGRSPEGTVQSFSGSWFIKVGQKWKGYNAHLWARHHGAIPDGMVVVSNLPRGVCPGIENLSLATFEGRMEGNIMSDVALAKRFFGATAENVADVVAERAQGISVKRNVIKLNKIIKKQTNE